jgi:hypothetical protein
MTLDLFLAAAWRCEKGQWPELSSYPIVIQWTLENFMSIKHTGHSHLVISVPITGSVIRIEISRMITMVKIFQMTICWPTGISWWRTWIRNGFNKSFKQTGVSSRHWLRNPRILATLSVHDSYPFCVEHTIWNSRFYAEAENPCSSSVSDIRVMEASR